MRERVGAFRVFFLLVLTDEALTLTLAGGEKLPFPWKDSPCLASRFMVGEENPILVMGVRYPPWLGYLMLACPLNYLTGKPDGRRHETA